VTRISVIVFRTMGNSASGSASMGPVNQVHTSPVDERFSGPVWMGNTNWTTSAKKLVSQTDSSDCYGGGFHSRHARDAIKAQRRRVVMLGCHSVAAQSPASQHSFLWMSQKPVSQTDSSGCYGGGFHSRHARDARKGQRRQVVMLGCHSA